MAILFERTIRYRDLEYRVVAELDDAAMMNDLLRLTVQGAVRKLPDGPWAQQTLELVVDVARSLVEIRREGGKVIATIPLTLPLPDSTDFAGNDIDVLADDKLFDGALGTSAAEELIHLIPTDPFFGCIVKGAVSTVVGQTIRCWRSTARNAPLNQRVRDIAGCLREYGLRMALTFLYRAGRCSLMAGMG
jgi:hypothetical protein